MKETPCLYYYYYYCYYAILALHVHLLLLLLLLLARNEPHFISSCYMFHRVLHTNLIQANTTSYLHLAQFWRRQVCARI